MNIAESGQAREVVLTGEWVLKNLGAIQSESSSAAQNSGGGALIDCSGLQSLDSSGASEIWKLKQRMSREGSPAQVKNLKSQFASLLELVEERYQNPNLPKPTELNLLQTLGKGTEDIFKLVMSLLAFVGETSIALGRLLTHPSLFRYREFAMQLKIACVDAIPIVALVTFLIGMVVAYLSGIQIEKYGANIFLVDAVSLGLCRELSPVIVAVVVAGRSGSAFTAQIGTMKLNEEIDAITTLGLSPLQVLVLPRILALVLAMPLLVFVGDMAGLLGSMMVANNTLGLSPATFVDRLQIVLTMKSFAVGLVKAPFFAAVIAMIGCKMGLSVENNARSVGLHTTSTVVQSIVAVILMNAAFAIIFQKLGI